ncbi:MAG: preprotein translocase subunit SecG [Rickettsiales bacterium]|nr:preprotein translocase subunit SecG [Rickettsiales bacterium]
MYLVLLVIHVIVTLALIVIILIQRSESDGLGGLGGGGGGVMTSRAQANLLTRTTAVLAAIFILNSLALSWLTQQDVRDRSLSDKLVEEQVAPISVPVPADITETLKKVKAPKAPAEVPKPE